MKKEIKSIILRYSIIILLGFFLMDALTALFKPLTIYTSFFLIDIFFNPLIVDNFFLIGSQKIFIIDACVATSAYFLLFLLNLATPNIKIRKRIFALSFSWALFLILNILRIFILSILYLNSSPIFGLFHLIFFYVVSVLFAISIWFLSTRIFDIKKIPFYSDLVHSKNFLKETQNA